MGDEIQTELARKSILKHLILIVICCVLWMWLKNLEKIQMVNIVMDGIIMFCVTEFLACLVVINGTKFINQIGFLTDFRWNLRLLELVSVVAVVGLQLSHRNRCPLWFDIILFLVFWFRLVREDDFYLNKMKTKEIGYEGYRKFRIYKEKYDEIMKDVERFNLKEEQLAYLRIENTADRHQKKKAENDKRSFVVGDELNPDYLQMPIEPEIRRGNSGKNMTLRYAKDVKNYIDSLSAAYQRCEQSEEKLKVMEKNVDNAIKYISTQKNDDAREIEEIIGQKSDMTVKIKKSYNLFNRKWFDRKKIKF
jgi:hypothetical protein